MRDMSMCDMCMCDMCMCDVYMRVAVHVYEHGTMLGDDFCMCMRL